MKVLSTGRRIILKWPDRIRIEERGLDLPGLGQLQVAGNEPVDSIKKGNLSNGAGNTGL